MCWEAFQVRVAQRQEKHHTWRALDSCLQWRQHSRRSSAPGLAALLSLPRADGSLPWGRRHWQTAPGALGPAAASAGKGWAWAAEARAGRRMLWGVGAETVHLEPAGSRLEEGRRWLTRRDRSGSPLKEGLRQTVCLPKSELRRLRGLPPEIKQINEKWWSFIAEGKTRHTKSTYTVNRKL